MKGIIFFILIIFTYQSVHSCEEAMIPNVLDSFNEDNIRQIIQARGRLALTKEDIKKSKCRSTKIPSLAEVKKHLNSKRGSQKKSLYKRLLGINTTEVKGIEFENEDPYILELFKLLFEKEEYASIDPKFNDLQEAFDINPECKKVFCAVEKIWGKGRGLGYYLLYMLSEHGYNGSEFIMTNSKRWSVGELERVIKGLEDVPKPLRKKFKSRPLVRLDKMNTYRMLINPSAVAFDDILVTDNFWSSELNDEIRPYIIFHEVSHNLSIDLSFPNFGNDNYLDETSEWREFSGWEDKGGELSSSKDNFVSIYAMSSPAEDLAESMSAYRYNPSLLKSISMEKYNYIKENIFKGIEFISQNDCQKHFNPELF